MPLPGISIRSIFLYQKETEAIQLKMENLPTVHQCRIMRLMLHMLNIANAMIQSGIFSGRYTSTICAASAIAKNILENHGIEILSRMEEAAGIKMPNRDYFKTKEKVRISTQSVGNS